MHWKREGGREGGIRLGQKKRGKRMRTKWIGQEQRGERKKEIK